jgi:hypothetical protein
LYLNVDIKVIIYFENILIHGYNSKINQFITRHYEGSWCTKRRGPNIQVLLLNISSLEEDKTSQEIAIIKLGIVAHIYNPSSREAEARGP